MKKLISFLTLAVLLVASCEKNSKDEDDDDVKADDFYVIKGDNIEGAEGVAGIKAGLVERAWAFYKIIAEAPFENSGFELRIPSTLSGDVLVPVIEDVPQGILISDPSANWAFLDFTVESTNIDTNTIAPYIRITYSISLDDSHIKAKTHGMASKRVVYVYVDRPVTLSGVDKLTLTTISDHRPWLRQYRTFLPYLIPIVFSTIRTEVSYTYNIIFNAGWNKVCVEYSFDPCIHTWDELLVLGSNHSCSYKYFFEYSTKNTSDCNWKINQFNNSYWLPENLISE